MDESPEPRAKRQKRESATKSHKKAAFERLKQLKGSKHKYEVSEMDDVYDLVDEIEYSKMVQNRQEDWIVDNGCNGYVEDGRDVFDDDLDRESIAAASKEQSGKKKKRKNLADGAGKGNLQYLLSNMVPKKKEEVKLGEDDILSELISEIDDENAGPSTRTPTIKPKSMPRFSLSAEKQAAKDYMKSLSALKVVQSVKEKPEKTTPQILKEVDQNAVEEKMEEADEDIIPETPEPASKRAPENKLLAKFKNIRKEVEENKKMEELKKAEKVSLVIEEFQTEDDMFDGFDVNGIQDVSSQEATAVTPIENVHVTEEQLSSGWKTMQEGTSNAIQIIDVNVDRSQIPMTTNEDGNQVFSFFWWDAFENPFKRPGEVFLFGKTYCEAAKTFASCCVIVRDIEKKVYLLPRAKFYEQGKQTDKPVALIDVYHEFNNTFAPLLQLQSFKSKKVTKNYCFDARVPTESEYLEVRYGAKHPRLDPEVCRIGGNTFSRVFGNKSSALEILLLERKIKGPCWLEISNPEPVGNPVSYCKFEINCLKSTNIKVVLNKAVPPPPLTVAALNMRAVVNPKNMNNEILMVSVLVQSKYAVDKKPPNPMFEQHFCVLTRPSDQVLPLNFHEAVAKFKGTKVQKMDSERALLNYLITQLAKIDADLIVGHDLQDYQIGLLCDRLAQCKIANFSRLGKLKRSDMPKKFIFEKELFVGRLVADVKTSAKELIKSRSFDLDALCQTVLKLKEGERTEVEAEDVPKYFQNSSDLLRLITLTMQDTAYILKMMYEMNVMPLALQISNIAGNVMSRTLLGGRSERNEYLLLHAFHDKGYIVPDKGFYKADNDDGAQSKSSKKKPAYSGGLVLEPKVGFYDKFILLMDFNSLYPSIIQEYNICFTTLSPSADEVQILKISDQSLPPGILPTEIRKLVESRREVKKLMSNPDISPDLRMQYNIRQTALKLTANSMYGCLGFVNSRFYAKNLAALVTHKGREILMNTKDLAQRMFYEVIYGDTDSIMINTNSVEFDEVMKIGHKIKQEVNRLYKQVELDVDGVFKYLLLLKKKKYAAVTISKDKNGELKLQQEHKGLDIVRRDWSQIAAAAGRFTLDCILSDQSSEDRIENIHNHLAKLKEDVEQNKVPLSLLVITKQLTKDPKMYPDKNQMPHVQVALRYNKRGGRVLKAGDTVPYVICDDGTNAPAMQRAYHIEELKNSEKLKIDVKYYLAQQIHPVISRLCDPLEGTDSYQIADRLGLDTASFKKSMGQIGDATGECLKRTEVKFNNVSPFVFKCAACKAENKVTDVLCNNVPFLIKCQNLECNARPIEHLTSVQNQLILSVRSFIKKYYRYELTCEDPACVNDTVRLPMRFAGKYPICTFCQKGVMYKKYTESDLYSQLSYFQHIFDLSKLSTSITLEASVEAGYHILKETVHRTLKHSGYAMINLTELFSGFLVHDRKPSQEIVLYCDAEEDAFEDIEV